MTDIITRLEALMKQSEDAIWRPAAEAATEIRQLRRANAELLTQLKRITLLARGALLCTSAEIAREAKPMLAAADAAIAKAEASP